MDPEQSNDSPSKHHVRTVSSDERRRGTALVAMPRRSTKGPLDAAEAQIPFRDVEDPLQSRSPQRLEARQVPLSSSASGQEGLPKPMTFDFPEKDFSFLLRPETYHPLSYLDTPPPFRSAALQRPSDTPIPRLLSTGHFREASILSAQHLTNADPPPPASQIFSLLYTRLASLTLTNNTALASQEAKVLSDLSSPFYQSPSNNAHIVPWDLRVLAVRLQSLGHGDWRRGITGYYDLAKEARREVGRSKDEVIWKIRLKDLGIRVANALVEMGDLEAAARHLRTLRADCEDSQRDSIQARQRETLVWLRLGDITSAKACLHNGEGDPGSIGAEDRENKVLDALCDMANGEYPLAVQKWQDLLDTSPDRSAAGVEMVQQNLAVCLLYTGQISQARDLLDGLLTTSKEARPFPALTFNLCTLYELCSEKSRNLKLQLAERIAAQGASAEKQEESQGTGLEGWRGWREMSNAGFKL
ncbi:MAG: hypothetical protein M4579_000627 [Chaenotheca gracillima]|nr:MAG: hypothetical protein M4579_000627 [Chaenotheca gracillima]